MAIYINACRIYLDSAPTVANSADIGLYAVGGGNSVFRWIESTIASYTPTYTWKSEILKPAPFAPVQESVDLTDGGNVPTIGGTSVRVINTLSYGGAMTQLDYILDSNDIRLSGLRCDIIRFEVSAGVLVEADGEIIYRGICGDPVWDERQFKIPLENALLKRKSNIATVINETDYPDADPNILGQSVPVSFGEFKPEFDNSGNPLWNGYAQFKRVANKESIFEVTVITLDVDKDIQLWPAGSQVGHNIFPVVGDDGNTPPIMYKIQLGITGAIAWRKDGSGLSKGIYSLDYFEDKYIYVIEGTGSGKYRKIESARVNIDSNPAIIELTISDYFNDTLAGNATATETDQTWVEIIDIARQYASDVWKCKDYLSEDGDPIGTGLNLYSFVAEQKAKVTTENTDAEVVVLPIEFYRLPSYAYEDSGNADKNLVDIDVSLFNNNPDSMNSFLVLPVKNIELYTEADMEAWFSDVSGINNCDTKLADGFYYDLDDVGTVTHTTDGNEYYIDKVTDEYNNTFWHPGWTVTATQDNTGPRVTVMFEFELPDFPKKFRHDNVYIGVYAVGNITTESSGVPAYKMYLRWKRFMGDPTDIRFLSNVLSVDVRMRDMLDQYFLVNPATKNKFFYYDNVGSHEVNGYTNYELTGIDTKEKYNSIDRCAYAFYVRHIDLDTAEVGTANVKFHELTVIFRKGISIKDAIYSPFRGRIYNNQWGQAAGSSSSSSSSSSESSPSSSSSSSLSSSSQSSPSSPSSSSSSSISSSSQSSPSSSSSSSESCNLGVGRKNACDMINNPVDILEHTLRLQNWSEQEETKEWGKEYASVPLIDVAITEGGFDYEDLNPIKALRPVRQIKKYNEAYTDKIARSICKQFFLCNYQNPSTGNESVSYIADKSLSTPATLLTLADIVGSIGEVVYPKVKGIYCEPVVRYAKNNANGQYEKVLQITNANKDTFDSSYVIGLSGADAELMWTRAHILWNAYRQVEPAPNDMANCDWIVTDSDAVWYLDTWLTYMGAINTDGTTAGVEFEPKKRIAFSVSYETGKDWFLTQHHRLKLPHQTNDTAIEFLIEKLSKNIVMGKEVVSLQAMLYGEVTDIAMYVQDVYDAGTLLADWQDIYTTQAEEPAQGADVQDIT